MKTVLTTLGPLLLFGAWVTQQFFADRWAARLADISTAMTHFLLYQSNRALFDALYLSAPESSRQKVYELSKENYRLGLERLRFALPMWRQINLQSLIAEQAKEYRNMGEYAQFQAEIHVVQAQLIEERKTIEALKKRSKKIFWALYALGSVVLVTAGLLGSVR